jgi:phosphatidate phosphatase APP1
MFDLKIPIARLRRMIHVISRPAKRRTLSGGIVIYPYRGYGSRREIFLMGRVFKQPGRPPAPQDSLRDDLADITRRLFRRGVAGINVKARLNGTEQVTQSDRDGYFRFHMRLDRPMKQNGPESLWHKVPIEVDQNGRAALAARAEILVPPPQARHLIISDIDDTVIYTGVADKLKMLIRLFLQGAQSRVAFPGTAALYNALHQGVSRSEMNPMLYVSRGPWSLYEILDEFFNMHGIPVGPVLFLREWGLSPRRPFPRRSRGHKAKLIRRMLDLYHDLPAVLIGDSGQHDPEIYTRMVREYPGRVKAVYIRNISPSPERHAAIETLAKEVTAQGSTLFLAADSFAMAAHMAQMGLISDRALFHVMQERTQQGESRLEPTLRVEAPDPAETRAAVERGELKRKLEQSLATRDNPANIAVQSGSLKNDKDEGSKV